eukprot:CAMPEP_0118996994 /NCGR_PEP_ID=MMETSP1173-20130426/61037_1 /TAXON_ID=1034831 /ORGANISM="Rhizochromulina marina cf, Strain CCMP1243" /LENGTH=318 /DNA_ID=CAMNT_0006948407 /DNA_START=53 /DNA_END=1005 /DNA_ORIENTATION=-
MEAAVREACAAAAGGAASTVALYPIDTVKTRMQAGEDPGCEAEGQDDAPRQGTWQVAARILREEGARGFFPGVVSSAVQSAIEKSVYFFAYTLIKAWTRGVLRREPGAWTSLVCGYVSEWVHMPVTLPLEVVTTRMQARSTQDSRGAGAALLGIFRQEGWQGLYRGWPAYFVLCLGPAIQFTVFERLRLMLLAAKRHRPPGRPVRHGAGAARESLSFFESLVLGAVARALSTLLVYPYIRAKVVLQSSPQGSASSVGTGSPGAPVGSTGPERKGAMPAGRANSPTTPSGSVAGTIFRLFQDGGVANVFHGIQPELVRG